MAVDRDALLMGLAAVFAGMSMLLTILSFTHSLFLLVVAVPFGVTTYVLWYHASGRLAERVRRRRMRESAAEARRRARTDAASGPGPGARFTAGAREARRGPGPRGGGDPRAGPGPGRGGANRRGPNAAATTAGPSPAEAYRILDLEPGADDDAVRRAYREKVKEVHPDTDTGDEESFKRVNRAYERLSR